LAIALLATLAGCSSPNPRYYTLAAPAPAAGTPAPTQTVWLGPVTIPAQVDRPQLVLAAGAHEVRIDEFSRWAAPLADAIASALAAQLAQRLPSMIVRPWGDGDGAPDALQVRVDVQRFETAPGDQVLIELAWTLRRPGAAPRSGLSVVREATAGSGIDAAVAAHSRALARAADEIAAAVRQP
jgi:hypothetical protein